MNKIRAKYLWALNYARSLRLKDLIEHQNSYIAGFEKAKELSAMAAIRDDPDDPIAQLIYSNILELGDEMVERRLSPILLR